MPIIFDEIINNINNNVDIKNTNFNNVNNYLEYITIIKNNILLEIKSSIENVNINDRININCKLINTNILKTNIFNKYKYDNIHDNIINNEDNTNIFKYIFYIIKIYDKYYIIKNFSADDTYYTFTIYPSVENIQKNINIIIYDYIGTFLHMYLAADHIEKNINKYQILLNTLCNYIPNIGTYKIINTEQNNIPLNIDKQIKHMLNNNQILTIESLSKNIELIQGPPGTGKSTTIIGIIQEKIPDNHKILCTCVQNQAIDSLVMKLKKYNLNFVVVGNKDRLGEESKKYSLDTIFEKDDYLIKLKDKIDKINKIMYKNIDTIEKNKQSEYIREIENKINNIQQHIHRQQYDITNKFQIFVGTIASSYTINNYIKKIDTIILDEAGNITEIDLISLIVKNPLNIIMIGDHKQLRPFSYNSKLNIISPLERFINNNYEYTTLHIQYRMDHLICELVSGLFYDNKLITSNNIQTLYKNSIEYHHVYGKSININKSLYNLEEINYINNLCNEYSNKKIMILTFYGAQVNYLKKNIKITKNNIDIFTIDGSQGRESDIVIVSLVCDHYRKFLDDPNRLCVMLSRAKNKLILVGQINKFIKKSNIWHTIFNKINDVNKMIDL